ncbi:hypothetical protein [Tabrizicola fusiformis]|uniref:hypothetical protein n=1 Tax=Tabrizicola sp. SY72 TaxID=2741673 RepID=UPI0015732F65|nr:hypothetical protein [Tabrizicola sp. SY72]NTT85731.1 hypothetical protein [Tabrizicola sp. SY72]
MTAMGANRALDHQAKTLAELTELWIATGKRVLELTELVETLEAKVAALEAARG